MDIAIKRYVSAGTLALFFPPMLPVSLALEEIERTNLLNPAGGKLPTIEAKDFTVDPMRTDCEQLMATVAGIYCENTAVDALMRAQGVLEQSSSTLREMPRWAQERELRSYFCYEAKRTPTIFDDYRLAINEAAARLMTFAGVQDWARKARSKEGKTPQYSIKPVVLTDPFIARVYASGMSTERIPVVSSHHKNLRGRAYITVALFDEHDCLVPEAAFGHMLYAPSWSKIQKSLMDADADASVWFAKIMPTANLPILSCIEFKE